ncbi:hypothetical protein M413DRAFT_443497 [Hebeloma cylindrosporum]|uniref:Uncharacterized protein n=1 Tax=Hebeloma cylindrosporum TaxID=76867 RepID=A0A0C3CIT3_HEBCY|nr:hypothetical protein M413DRAFT_443497 [Hebeloma cylindrosporum h7]
MASYFLNRHKSNQHGNTAVSSNLIIPDHDSRVDGIPSDYYTVDKYAAAVLFEVFLYGVYSSLFAICLRVLLKNKRTRQKMLLGCAMIMFSLATVDVVLEIGFLFWFVVKKNEVPEDDLHFKFLIYITSNVIADGLVIYRCYSVWNNSKRVILLPCFLLFAGSACGYTFIGLSKEEYHFRQVLVAFLFATVTLNTLVTVLMGMFSHVQTTCAALRFPLWTLTPLSAGRIWWIARKARSILGPGLSSKYNTMIAMIVESGMIYSIYVVLDVVFPNLLLDAGLAQVVVSYLPSLSISSCRQPTELPHGGRGLCQRLSLYKSVWAEIRMIWTQAAWSRRT